MGVPTPEGAETRAYGLFERNNCRSDEFDSRCGVEELVHPEQRHGGIVTTEHLAVGLTQFASKPPVGGDVGDENVKVDEVGSGGTRPFECHRDVATRLTELVEEIFADGAVGPMSGLAGQKDNPTRSDNRGMRKADRLGQLDRVDEEVTHRPLPAGPLGPLPALERLVETAVILAGHQKCLGPGL
jgi:hypothetical protein